ncbi:IclR family transcriptional regulator [Pseudonocardia spinosispora]|uniref:IclR family transcriptional regulator n=1 Tax=Pseudonocardia spinosispora TaxID=103441 RepID=UPI00042952FA|nr:IclR family transcriptional regulator C-terminal domain-containing protein [Pseudonocardia spinosispora]
MSPGVSRGTGAPEDADLLPGTGRNESLHRAFELLRRVASAEQGVSTADLTEASGLPRTTVSRLLASLHDVGAVARPGPRRRWVLGPTITDLTRMAPGRAGLLERALPVLRELAETSGETSMIEVPVSRTSARVLAEVEGHHIVGVRTVWRDRALTSPATGVVRMLLAELPPAEVERAVRALPIVAHTAATKTSVDDIVEAVGRVRAEGVSMVVDEVEEGLSGVGVAIRDGARLMATVSVYLPTARLDALLAAGGIDRLRRAADALSRPYEGNGYGS